MRRATVSLTCVILLGNCTPATPEAAPTPAPALEASVSYEVFPPTVQFGGTPKATFRNTGNVPLEYRDSYLLERDFDGEWIELAQPEGGDIACIDHLESYLLDVGETRTQEISVCDQYGQVHPLSPGDYRLTKTVRTIAATPDIEPQAITEVVPFEVAEDTGPVPPPSACDVLCLSDTRVHAGEEVTVTFDPPMRFIWGARSELHLGSDKTATPIAWLVGWKDRDEELMSFFPGEGGGVEDIGFYGRGEWTWKVPMRLEPGIYAIAKDGIRGRPGSAPMRERQTWWSAAFEVTQ